MRWWLLLFGTLAAAAAEPPPDAAAQQAMIEGVKRTAQRYQDELPDFVCTLQTKRFEARGSSKKLKQRDSDEVEFRYVGHTAYRRVLKIDNQPAHSEILTGFRSDGVLPVVGFLPEWLLGPAAKTRFEWSHWGAAGGRRAAVFSLRLAAVDSQLPLSGDRGSTMVGLRGVMYVDPVSTMVLRLELKLEIPPAAPLDVVKSSFDLDYGAVRIAGQEFFLPVRTVVQMRTGSGLLSRNETEVVRYQKYAADSSVRFGESDR